MCSPADISPVAVLLPAGRVTLFDMIYIHWLIFVIYAVVVVLTMITILMDNRQPAKTMAWILVLWFIPLLGIILYFFFGQNIRREHIVSKKSLDQLTKRSMFEFVEQRNLTLPDEHRKLIDLFTNQQMALPFKGNTVEIYKDGYEFFPALLAEIAKARHHIHIDVYIFCDDALGRLVSDALIAKSREGVEVRLIYDDVACWSVKNSFYERMREEGIEVHPFMPVKFPVFTSKANYRNHRKVIVIDGKVGFIGGMNIALRYVKGYGKGKKHTAWRDTHMKIEGTAVYGLQRAFLIDWYFVDQTLITNRKYYPQNIAKDNDCLMQIVSSNPTDSWPTIEQGYVNILLNAKKYVYIETPYFMPTEPVLFAMRTAALAGVDVRLMLPLKNDSQLVQWATTSYVMETVEAGVTVLFYKAGFNHSKVIISDDSLVSCGSLNVDFRSFEHNFECCAFLYDQDMALRFKEVFAEDEKECVPIDQVKDLSHRSFLIRLWESLVRLLSPLM